MPTATAYRVEPWLACMTPAEMVPVSQLRPGDLVFDTQGDPHPLILADRGSAGSMWIQRRDLDYAEHLQGEITIVRCGSRRTEAV